MVSVGGGKDPWLRGLKFIGRCTTGILMIGNDRAEAV